MPEGGLDDGQDEGEVVVREYLDVPGKGTDKGQDVGTSRSPGQQHMPQKLLTTLEASAQGYRAAGSHRGRMGRVFRFVHSGVFQDQTEVLGCE